MEPVTTTSYIVLGIALFMLLNSAAIAVYAERRVAAFIQNRLGPNRVGPYGLFQPLADVLKLLMKEDVTPRKGFRTIHAIAPVIPVATALMTVAVIPFGDGLFATDINDQSVLTPVDNGAVANLTALQFAGGQGFFELFFPGPFFSGFVYGARSDRDNGRRESRVSVLD